jgi:dienelactone hydrolase
VNVGTTPFEIAGARGEALRGDLRLPEGDGPFPVVVVLHGFKGFRRWGFFPWIGESLARRGFASLVPDFSHNGTDATGEAYPRKDLFFLSSWATHSEDLDRLLVALRTGALPRAAALDASRVAVLGHSLGGGLAVLRAARDPGIRGVVGLAPVATVDRFPPSQKERWRRLGRHPIVNSRTGEVLDLGPAFLDDLETRTAELDIRAAATRLPCPLLVVHGAEDTSVPPEEGRSLVEGAIAAGRPARFRLLPGTQHTFDAVHPFTGPTPALEAAFAEAAAFLETYIVRFDGRLPVVAAGRR